MEMVARLVEEKPLVIFSKSSCYVSHSTKSFLRGFGANPIVYELDQMPNGAQIERALVQLGCTPSVPAVFIGQQFVGNTVMSLHVQNKLVPLLLRAKAIWIWSDN